MLNLSKKEVECRICNIYLNDALYTNHLKSRKHFFNELKIINTATSCKVFDYLDSSCFNQKLDTNNNLFYDELVSKIKTNADSESEYVHKQLYNFESFKEALLPVKNLEPGKILI